MIVNPYKFQAIAFDKRKFKIGSALIQVVQSVDILGITIDDKMNFNLHVDNFV